MTEEYIEKNDVPNLYNMLGLNIDVCKDPKCDEIIKKAYLSKVKKFHPDKHRGRKDVEEVFELLTMAYDILRESNQREEYNNKLHLGQQCSNDFHKLRDNTKKYIDSIGEYKPPNDEQKLRFQNEMEQLDKKHGYNRDEGDLSMEDAAKRMKKLKDERDAIDKEKPEKLFEGEIDLAKFNAAFDMAHAQQMNDEYAMMEHTGAPAAWNSLGSGGKFADYDNLDNMYVENNDRFDTGCQNFSSVNFEKPHKKITREEMNNIQGADYVNNHNKLDDDYYSDIKARLREREDASNKVNNMKYNEFERDNTAGYGIFDQLGFNIDNKLTLDVDEDDIAQRFERLMYERENGRPSEKKHVRPAGHGR